MVLIHRPHALCNSSHSFDTRKDEGLFLPSSRCWQRMKAQIPSRQVMRGLKLLVFSCLRALFLCIIILPQMPRALHDIQARSLSTGPGRSVLSC